MADVLAKTPGHVPCAHCSRPGASESCPICTLIVCEGCRVDWTTCTEPCGREIRLGMGARLRGVSDSGRLGLVGGWRRHVRVVDLRRMCYLATDGDIARRQHLHITNDGRLVQEHRRKEWSDYPKRGGDVFVGVEVIALPEGDRSHIEIEEPDSALDRPWPQEHTLRLTRDDNWIWYERHDETLQFTDLRRRTTYNVEPVPRAVIQCAWLDTASRLLATGVFGAVHLHDFVHGRVTQSHVAPIAGSDILAVRLARGRMLVLAGGSHGTAQLRVYDVRGNPATIGDCIYERDIDGPVATALSGNGHYAAVSRRDHVVELHTFEHDHVTLFDGHTDTVKLVRFVRGDNELVTADDDNRVIIRPLVDGTYVRHTVEVDLPSESTAFPDLSVEPG